ncbi:MAG TPA: phage/plasmid primase, P4 family [Beijerinckiaceae bacterium]|nr:phage/plasmid primase, P4 family [Beijerinckiaceae bacterium]
MEPSDPSRGIAAILAGAPVLAGPGGTPAPGLPAEGGAEPPGAPGGAPPEDGFDDGAAEPDPSTDWGLVRACAQEPQNDIGNSRRLRLRHGHALIHVPNIGWHVYDGRRWAEDVDEAGTRPLAHGVVEAIGLEAHVLEPTEREQAEIDAAEAAALRRGQIARERDELAADTGLSKAERERQEAALKREDAACKLAVALGAAAQKAWRARQAQRRRFANASGNKGKIDGMLAEALAYLSVPVARLDRDPLALNLANGTLRFVAEEDLDCPDPDVVRHVWRARLDPHDRADLITKLADTAWEPQASAPTFERFLGTILPNRAVRDYVQRYLGYALTGLTREQVFCLFFGEGRNGKSTLVDLVSRLLGDYATSLPIDTLVSSGGPKKGSEATPDLARLPGARLVRTAEPKEGLAFDESLIKGLTSGEPIPVRRLNQDFVDVYPTFKLVISANRKPAIYGDDDGIWRRVSLVPFEVQIPEAEVDKGLGEKLWAERAGVLAWLVAGALDYLGRGGLDPPAEVRAATQDYREESDLVGAFVRNALEVTGDPLHREEAGDLWASFETYCRKAGQTPIGKNKFQRRIARAAEKHGFHKGKASVSIYEGVRIRPAYAPPPAPPGGSLGG